MKIDIPILSNSTYDLTKFDFAFKDIYLVDIQSKDFRDYIKSFDPDSEFPDVNVQFLNQIIRGIHFDFQKYYAIIKKDFKTDYEARDIYNVFKILLIIFPSDLQISHVLHFYESEKVIQSGSMSSWDEKITGDFPGKRLRSHANYLEEINEFIKIVFDRLKQDNYIGLSISHYLTSFKTSHFHYQFLALCMVLEAAISGTSELTYRLKRNIAVLLGESQFCSNLIFKNLDKIYSIRSKIIHGDEYHGKKMMEYLPYLQATASRTIIELLMHNYTKNKELNHRITELGFGDGNKISENYKLYTLNLYTRDDINWTEI